MSKTFWLTGLSGAGKTTLAKEVKLKLNKSFYILDNDIVRSALCSDLGFSKKDRGENNRRIAELCKILNDIGINVIATFISPYIEHRELSKKIIGENNFKEIYINTSLNVCEKRDVKGLYKKARNGDIKEFTGVSDPYEIPINPSLIISTENISIEDSAKILLEFIKNECYPSGDFCI